MSDVEPDAPVEEPEEELDEFDQQIADLGPRPEGVGQALQDAYDTKVADINFERAQAATEGEAEPTPNQRIVKPSEVSPPAEPVLGDGVEAADSGDAAEEPA